MQQLNMNDLFSYKTDKLNEKNKIKQINEVFILQKVLSMMCDAWHSSCQETFF